MSGSVTTERQPPKRRAPKPAPNKKCFWRVTPTQSLTPTKFVVHMYASLDGQASEVSEELRGRLKQTAEIYGPLLNFSRSIEAYFQRLYDFLARYYTWRLHRNIVAGECYIPGTLTLVDAVHRLVSVTLDVLSRKMASANSRAGLRLAKAFEHTLRSTPNVLLPQFAASVVQSIGSIQMRSHSLVTFAPDLHGDTIRLTGLESRPLMLPLGPPDVKARLLDDILQRTWFSTKTFVSYVDPQYPYGTSHWLCSVCPLLQGEHRLNLDRLEVNETWPVTKADQLLALVVSAFSVTDAGNIHCSATALDRDFEDDCYICFEHRADLPWLNHFQAHQHRPIDLTNPGVIDQEMNPTDEAITIQIRDQHHKEFAELTLSNPEEEEA